jgi:hypothetical protein
LLADHHADHDSCSDYTPVCRTRGETRCVRFPSQGTPFLRLSFLASASLLIHGYHLGTDDAAIYVPGIKRAFDPELFSFGSQFFTSHARLSLFSALVGNSARLIHLPIDWVILLWHWAGLFLLLIGAWRLLNVCFESEWASWGGVALLAGTLGVPVAGTALAIADPYVTSRTLSTPFTLLCIAAYLSNSRGSALAWLAATAAVHPQMGAYCGAFLASLMVMSRTREWNLEPAPAAALALPFFLDLHPSQGAAREALHSRTFFFLYNWAWYEWVGIFAPLALVGWAATLRLRTTTNEFRLLLRTLVPYGLVFLAVGALLSSSVQLENLARLQPMRAFHLFYVVFFVLLGGMLGEYVLRRAAWRWLVLFVPLAGGMWFVASDAYAASPHIEWPGAVQSNPWLSAFYWIRANTPKDAVFALGPNFMAARGEDEHGFRAVAERSMLADRVKDSGVVSLFPQLADEWQAQTSAQWGWEHFGPDDFGSLARRYPVTWVVTRRSAARGLDCPFVNSELAVCHIAPATSRAKSAGTVFSLDPAIRELQPAAAAEKGAPGND